MLKDYKIYILHDSFFDFPPGLTDFIAELNKTVNLKYNYIYLDNPIPSKKIYLTKLAQIFNEINNFKPNLILSSQYAINALLPENLFPSAEIKNKLSSFFKKLKKISKLAMICLDDPSLLKNRSISKQIKRFIIFKYDYVFTHSLQHKTLYLKKGIKKVFYFPNLASPRFFYPEKDLTKNKVFSYDVSFIGQLNSERKFFIDNIINDYTLKDIKTFFGPVKSYDVARKIYSNSKINLSYGSYSDTKNERSWGYSDRFLNISLCRSLTLHDYRKHLIKEFAPARDILIFKNITECKNLIKLYLNNYNLRKLVSINAKNMVKKYFLPKKRVNNFLQIVQNNLIN